MFHLLHLGSIHLGTLRIGMGSGVWQKLRPRKCILHPLCRINPYWDIHHLTIKWLADWLMFEKDEEQMRVGEWGQERKPSTESNSSNGSHHSNIVPSNIWSTCQSFSSEFTASSIPREICCEEVGRHRKTRIAPGEILGHEKLMQSSIERWREEARVETRIKGTTHW